MRVDVALDATQAKRLLAERSYAGMTLDLRLPDQDGISLIRELRGQERTRTLPIVVVSVKASEGKKELNGEAFLVMDWIDKPIDHSRLIRAVREAVAQSPGHRLRILHVEDDPDIVEVVAAILGDMAALECAGTLEEATRKTGASRYDLVILDLGLPDGFRPRSAAPAPEPGAPRPGGGLLLARDWRRHGAARRRVAGQGARVEPGCHRDDQGVREARQVRR